MEKDGRNEEDQIHGGIDRLALKQAELGMPTDNPHANRSTEDYGTNA